MKNFIITAIVAYSFLLAATAEACPNCFASSNTQALQAYYVSIAFMALIPFGLVAGIVLWLRRQQQAHERSAMLPSDSQA